MKTVLPVDHVLFHLGLLSQNATKTHNMYGERALLSEERIFAGRKWIFSRNLNGKHGMNPDIK